MAYSLELGPHVIHLTCDCCGRPVHRVWGFVQKDGAANAVYYALLAEHEDGRRQVGITVSIGNWWDDDARHTRRWCHIYAWGENNQFILRVGEPTESNFYPWESGGKPMTRDQVLADLIKEEFFAVCDYVNVEDPAINSFLWNGPINGRDREFKPVSTAK